jgi:hypothetical protein
MKIAQGNTIVLPAHGFKKAIAVAEAPVRGFYDCIGFIREAAIKIDKPAQAVLLNFEDNGFTPAGSGQSAYQKRTGGDQIRNYKKLIPNVL